VFSPELHAAIATTTARGDKREKRRSMARTSEDAQARIPAKRPQSLA
jgi:hypothetical protein